MSAKIKVPVLDTLNKFVGKNESANPRSIKEFFWQKSKCQFKIYQINLSAKMKVSI